MMRIEKTKPSSPIYQLKITLRGSRPPIWRRVQVSSDVTLAKLHKIIQVAMGWGEEHLHVFDVGGISYGEPDPELEFENERRIRLNEVAPREKSKFRYEYDFGDSWEHEILVEKRLPAEPGVHYPRCIKGIRACPPEDCGGVWGYANLLETIQDPTNPEYEDMREWVGEDFDPEAFDLEAANHALKSLR
jgi:hypothetical protein